MLNLREVFAEELLRCYVAYVKFCKALVVSRQNEVGFNRL